MGFLILLAQMFDKRAPEFLTPLPITKTRAGMQVKVYSYEYMRFIFQISVYKYSISKDLRFDLHSFVNIVDKLLYWYMCTLQFSCAAPIDGVNNSGYREVWVCNSDGYVGHMCLLSLQPEPIVTLNTPVPGCNARILCICAVPAYSGTFRR